MACQADHAADAGLMGRRADQTSPCARLGENRFREPARLRQHVRLADLGVDLFDEGTRDRLERRFWAHAQELLRLGQAVILEFGFWGRSEREEKRLGARALGVPVELHHLSASIDELCRRLEARNAAGGSGTVPITRELLEDYAKLFEAPGDEERVSSTNRLRVGVCDWAPLGALMAIAESRCAFSPRRRAEMAPLDPPVSFPTALRGGGLPGMADAPGRHS